MDQKTRDSSYSTIYSLSHAQDFSNFSQKIMTQEIIVVSSGSEKKRKWSLNLKKVIQNCGKLEIRKKAVK